MKSIETDIPGVLLVEPAVFTDHRGFFMETFHQEKYAGAGIHQTFVQDNRSHSRRGVLRGLHYQLRHPQDKLVYVVAGEIFDVVVDIRRGSPMFGRWFGAILSAENQRQLFAPKGVAHGFCVLSESADVIYKCSDLYARGDEYGVLWNDPDLGVAWPVTDAILSDKDAALPRLKDAPPDALPMYMPPGA
ncbi:MAG: dTDP-4-dehydrorhamnose 3,5-epimerase [Desulfobacterales bacterium]|nr:dTDP-4-dehydrorhamnose 3,5-epimerase [Desulfobacterales bacterium]